MSNAILIAYFSRSGNNYVNGSIIDIPVGNTEIAAKKIVLHSYVISNKSNDAILRLHPNAVAGHGMLSMQQIIAHFKGDEI